MNNKALTLSLVMAVLAVFFVQSYVSSIEDEAKKKFGTEVLVIKAKKDIKEMESLNETMLEMKLIPKRFLEPAAIYYEKKDEDKETAKGMKGLTGSIAVVPIKKGEQVTYNKLTEPSLRTGLASQITPGRRAYTIPVNEHTSVGKLVKPGDRVDVIAVVDGGGGKDNKLAKTVLQDVVVLATGHAVTNNAPRIVEADPYGGKDRVKSLAEDFSFTSVTLEVEPMQAQALAVVMANGDTALSLALRNNDDTERPPVASTTLPDVLGADSARIQRNIAGVKR